VSKDATNTPPTVAARLPCESASVAEARQVLAPLEPAVDEETIQTLKLLVTELVSNSVRHSEASCEDEIELSIEASDDRVRVEVADGGPGFEPRPRDDDHDQASGWGLHLVECLSDRWGTECRDRMAVWFELDVNRSRVAHGERPYRAGRSAPSGQDDRVLGAAA
jgi:anti-sigma regulatory factor (Ser/Thr protein kinase)